MNINSNMPCPCRPAIDALLAALPSKAGRQTVLFSATFPADIAALASYALRPGYQMVDTVGETAQQTADKVQSPVIKFMGPDMIVCKACLLGAVQYAASHPLAEAAPEGTAADSHRQLASGDAAGSECRQQLAPGCRSKLGAADGAPPGNVPPLALPCKHMQTGY